MVDSAIYFRSDVTQLEMTGHSWVPLCREIDFDAKKNSVDNRSAWNYDLDDNLSTASSSIDPLQSLSLKAQNFAEEMRGFANRSISKIGNRLGQMELEADRLLVDKLQKYKRSGFISGANKFLRSSSAMPLSSSAENLSRDSVFYANFKEETAGSLSSLAFKGLKQARLNLKLISFNY